MVLQVKRDPPTTATSPPIDLASLSIYVLLILWTFINCSESILAATYDADSSLNPNNGNEDRCNRTVDIYRTITEPRVTMETRGKAMHCSYRVRIQPPRDDWVVFLRFTRLRVGEVSPDRKECIGGFIQIIDGYKDSNISKRTNPGFFCGEIDMPKTYIAETPHVRVIFHAESFSEDSYFQFDVSVERQNEFFQRLGQYHQLHPNRRGKHVESTYCDRIFENCSPGHCYVQSPGFPEVYPRNLRCRYLLISKKSLIGMEIISFDVDGQECDSLLMCFPRPVTINPEECPHDYLRIYDGRDESAPVIATLCGRGRLPSSLIASGPAMLVEFVSSPAGHLINSGFQLKAENIFESGDSQAIEMRPDGTCYLERQLVEANSSNIFTNIRSWYPPKTICSYKFIAPQSEDRISLHFVWFRIDRVTLCEESLRVFDGIEADPKKLMNRLCDTNKPMGGASKSTYVTSGPGLLVQFSSASGSLSGASINYGFDVRRVLPEKKAEPTGGPTASNSSQPPVPPEDMSTDSFTLLQGQPHVPGQTSAACPARHHHAVASLLALFAGLASFPIISTFSTPPLLCYFLHCSL